MKTWFISDTHFWHKNILQYTDRPFNSVEEMNEGIIDNWNTKVAADDVVYHLGDVSFGSLSRTVDILDRLKGKKRLVYGNHDRGMVKKERFQEHWEWIRPYHSFRHEQTRINLFHFPIAAWDEQGRGSIHLHGHSHGSYDPIDGKILDVGLDGPMKIMGPIELDTVLTYMSFRRLHVWDGHKER